MKPEDFKEIRYQKEDNGIVTILLNTPKRKNALSLYTFYELYQAAELMAEDETAGVMILTGARDPDIDDPTQEAFSSGGYFHPKAWEGVSPEIQAQIDPTDIAQMKFTLRMWRFEKPVIAAVNGLAIGGAFTLCLSCCDLIYCSEHAWVFLPFVGLGILPELASSYLLPRLIGLQRAKELLFFPEPLPARKLLELGLVNKVLPHENLMPYAREQALKLVPPKGASYAVRLTKRVLHQGLIQAVTQALEKENQGLNQAFTTADFAEALTARAQKRPPIFQGR